MADKCTNHCVKEAVCVETNKVYDLCRSKDCLEDLRVYFCAEDQFILNNATSAKVKSVEVRWVLTDIEPVPFNRGYYTVDIKYFFLVTFEVLGGSCGAKPVNITGVASYEKRCILFGSEGGAKTFSTPVLPDPPDIVTCNEVATNLPNAVVEVVDPIALSSKIVEVNNCCCRCNDREPPIPACVARCFGNDLVTDGEQIAFVTLGVFTIIKMMRKIQLLIPVYDYAIPRKECVESSESDPCEMFDKIKFPLDDFFPPKASAFDNIFETESSNSNSCNKNNCR
jgi:hypothetical protein